MNALKSIALAGAMLLSAWLPASAVVVIQKDNGGIIVDYVKKYTDIRDSGERIIVDGECWSACTLFLGLVPKENVCLTDRAVLGFHSATTRQQMPGGKVKVSHAVEFSALMFSLYPSELRRMLKVMGWDGDQPEIPHPDFVTVEAHQLTKVTRKCSIEDWRP
ncbi:hypothetical protein V1279_003032 [Bradyrhizobium sp. AZCC 1610]|uniref:hypothetical protein n=1 Tax=Bradyrhizobium sp. AZCC 1610 TaxID=3117020 RepID=UPI002FF07E43